jgi:hypothetical protein
MIVPRDLLNCPKFMAFRVDVGPIAMECLIRLWAYCEADQRGENLGRINDSVLERICMWEGDPGKLAAALIEPLGEEPGFVVVHNGEYIVKGWNERNRSLCVRWEAGRATALAWQRRKKAEAQSRIGEVPCSPRRRNKADKTSHRHKRVLRGAIRGEERSGEKCSEEKSSPLSSSGGVPPTPPSGSVASPGSFCPSSCEEVVAYGTGCTPPIPYDRCVDFWAHFEGQVRYVKGERVWQTSKGVVITNWKERLKGWRQKPHSGKPSSQSDAKPTDAARLVTIERRLHAIGDGNADTLLEKRRLQKEHAQLLQQQMETTAKKTTAHE